MFRKILVLGAVVILLGGCGVNDRAGVDIMSYPVAKVFIDGKEAGSTPYKNSYLKSGLVEIKLITDKREWVKKLELVNNVTTVVDREFGADESADSGYILSMERTGDVSRAGIILNSDPSGSAIHVDGEIKGYSPVRLDDIGEGDRQITISFPMKKSLTVFARAINGYRLLVDGLLANSEKSISEPLPTPTNLTVSKPQIIIRQTETGWLRVRREASNSSDEVGRVGPGEKFVLIEEKGDWYLIDKGWVSAKYADKL